MINLIPKYNIYILRTILCSALFLFSVSCSTSIVYQPPVNDPLVVDEVKDEQLSIFTYNIQALFGKDESKLDALLNIL